MYIYTYIYTYLILCVYTYIQTHTHTHTHRDTYIFNLMSSNRLLNIYKASAQFRSQICEKHNSCT